MNDTATLLIAIASLAFDPLALLVYLPAGVLIRKRSLAVAVGFLWMLILQLAVVRPWSRLSFSPDHFVHFLATIGLAALVTLLVHVIASRFRDQKQKNPLAKLRSFFGFKKEWSWRVFVVLQLLGIIALVYMNLTSRFWSVLPYTPRGEYGRPVPPTSTVLTPYLCQRYSSSPMEAWRFENNRWRYKVLWQKNSYDVNYDVTWDFLDTAYWTKTRQNWIMLLALLGPFALSKCVAWIAADTQKQPGNTEPPQ